MRKITQARLREVLDYNPETGVFTWRERPGDLWSTRSWNTKHAGSEAGHAERVRGYRRVNLDGKMYLGHRLAWLYVTGEWPRDDIDHRDGDTRNNRFENLRSATRSNNMANMRRPKNNTTGVKGVIYAKHIKKWVARIYARNQFIHIGVFASLEEAAAAYAAAAAKYHGEFARPD